MKTETIQQSAFITEIKKQPNHPVNHLIYNSPTLGLFFYAKYADTKAVFKLNAENETAAA